MHFSSKTAVAGGTASVGMGMAIQEQDAVQGHASGTAYIVVSTRGKTTCSPGPCCPLPTSRYPS